MTEIVIVAEIAEPCWQEVNELEVVVMEKVVDCATLFSAVVSRVSGLADNAEGMSVWMSCISSISVGLFPYTSTS